MENEMFNRAWLEEIKEKAYLLKKVFSLKQAVGQECFDKYLEIYETRDYYLNRLPIGELTNFIKDLEKTARNNLTT